MIIRGLINFENHKIRIFKYSSGKSGPANYSKLKLRVHFYDFKNEFSREKGNFALRQNYKLLRCDHLINRMCIVTLKRRRQKRLHNF